MPKSFKWQITEADAADLTALIDLAVKSGGIKVSARAAQLHASLVTAFNAPAESDPTPTAPQPSGDVVVPIAGTP